MDEDSERRRYRRVRLDGRMTGRATVLADVRVLALSETGASLETSLPMALGTRCDLTLNLSHVSVDLKGSVVHVAPPDEKGPYVVGVDFVDVESVEQGLLLSFLERERRGSL